MLSKGGSRKADKLREEVRDETSSPGQAGRLGQLVNY